MADRIAKYRIVRRLGEGGMGEVFLAEDPELERTVAIKVMTTELAKDPEQRKRFRTEAKAASALIHPNICVIHEVGETEDGRPFLAMEYVEGQTAAMLVERRRLNPREVVDIGIQVAAGLDAAHERRIVHRDIKPQNIIVDRNGRTKVLDFGLAKRLAQDELGVTSSLAQTKTGVLIGTPYYMSPEQVLGREVDHRSDIFSLGTVLYELIAGQRPFLGRTFGEAINNVVNQKPEPLRSDNPQLPESLERIVFKCLEKDPDKRYASVRALSQDLSEVRRELEQRTSQPSVATPPPAAAVPVPAAATAPEQRVKRSMPIWIPATAGGLLLLAAIGAFIASRHMPRRGEPAGNKAAGDLNVEHRSVAVLPLDNFTGDPENDYLTDGLTEEITTALSRISGLKVAARNSAFAFKGRKQDARKIGEALRVNTLLEGSVRKMGNQIRVTAQLINVADGFHLWSETYDRSADDIIGVQEDIARRIAERLQGKADLPRQPPVDPEAHRLYLQARLYWNKRTEPGLNKAAHLFQQAIDKQPTYAAAHAGLAATYCVLPQYSLEARASKYKPLARAAAERALELDAGCAEAHAVLGHLQSEAKDYKGAEEHFQSAIRLNPSYATAHHWYGLYLGIHGQKEKAATELLAAMELDPLSPVIRTVVAQQHYVERDFERAIPALRSVVEDFPEFPVARDSLIAALLLKGNYEDALIEIDNVMALRTSQPLVGLEMKAYTFARMGRMEEAKKIEADLERRRAEGTPLELPLAFIHLGMRQYDKVLDTLHSAFATGDLACEVLADPMFDEIRDQPRFQQLLKSSGID